MSCKSLEAFMWYGGGKKSRTSLYAHVFTRWSLRLALAAIAGFCLGRMSHATVVDSAAAVSGGSGSLLASQDSALLYRTAALDQRELELSKRLQALDAAQRAPASVGQPAAGTNCGDVCGPASPLITDFYRFAKSRKKQADKIYDHTYQTMYGIFLASKQNTAFKMIEIGLGCGMSAGPGASAFLWKDYFPKADVWFAEYNADCVTHAKSINMIDAELQVVTGDQGDPSVVRRWIEETSGGFDVIIDDGGHRNSQILTSFELLWAELKPGGLYFIEDLHVGRRRPWEDTRGKRVVSDVIQAWIEQLLIVGDDWSPHAKKHPLPQRVKFITCQAEACVIAKCLEGDTTQFCTAGFKGLGDHKNNFPNGW